MDDAPRPIATAQQFTAAMPTADANSKDNRPIPTFSKFEDGMLSAVRNLNQNPTLRADIAAKISSTWAGGAYRTDPIHGSPTISSDKPLAAPRCFRLGPKHGAKLHSKQASAPIATRNMPKSRKSPVLGNRLWTLARWTN